MKKMAKVFKTSALLLGTAVLSAGILISCGSDDDPKGGSLDNDKAEAIDLDYTPSNADSWHSYSVKVAELLARDSEDLYNSWAVSYDGGKPFAEQFKDPSPAGAYKSHIDCIDQIIEGCSDIAGEVGDAKIGDPYDLYIAGKTTEALYAVESWYSWHSREDYRNNIFSIRNSYNGTLDGSVAEHSLRNLVNAVDPELNKKVVAAIDGAAKAIYNIPQPFRNNINSSEARNAMDACADLYNFFDKDLKSLVNGLNASYDAQLRDIVTNYVDVVVLPTYAALKECNAALLRSIKDLASARTDSAFKAACDAWLNAREPWERSEAFLFGRSTLSVLTPIWTAGPSTRWLSSTI